MRKKPALTSSPPLRRSRPFLLLVLYPFFPRTHATIALNLAFGKGLVVSVNSLPLIFFFLTLRVASPRLMPDRLSSVLVLLSFIVSLMTETKLVQINLVRQKDTRSDENCCQ